MKYFIAFSFVLFAVSAMPTQFGNDADIIPDTIHNATLNKSVGQFGFATLNGGTSGGAGGAVWTVWDAWALRDAVTGNASRIIYVRGRIDLTQLFTESPGVSLMVGNSKTIIGGDSNAMIFGGGLNISYANQVIIQNLKFHNALSYAPSEQPDGNGGIINMVPGGYSEIDAINIQTSLNVWVDHCEFADDPWIADSIPDDMRRHDGFIDIKRAANWISVSNSIFRNHNRNMLVGHADNNAAQDLGKLKVTYYNNWFMGVTQRSPRVRFGEVHVLNNLYTDISLYAIGAGAGALVYVERNVFIDTDHAWTFPFGTPDPIGNLLPVDNQLINSTYDSGIPDDLGWVPAQYYDYNAMAVGSVEAHVRNNAGVW